MATSVKWVPFQKINNGKTEVIRFMSKHNNTKFGNEVSGLVSVGSNNIIPASPVRNMGVIMSGQVQHRIQGGLTCLNTSVGHRGGGGRRPPVSVANITM